MAAEVILRVKVDKTQYKAFKEEVKKESSSNREYKNSKSDLFIALARMCGILE